jgi:hypothetical protein
MMDNTLFLDGKNSFYRFISLFGMFCLDDTQAIHHSVDMGIDTDIGHIIENREYYFSRFYADPGKCLYELEIVWQYSLVVCCEDSASLFYKTGFILKKVYIFEITFYLLE